jgi:LysM repeat protein
MIKKIILILAVIFLCNNNGVFSQESQVRHTIVKGETITKIAKDYNVTPADIYKINPESNKVLKLNSVLLIPTVSSKKVVDAVNTTKNISTIIHEVLPKETIYSISRQYGVTVKEINQSNPILESQVLKMGQKIVLLGKGAEVTRPVISESSKNELSISKMSILTEPKSLSKNEKAIVCQAKAVEYYEDGFLVHEVMPKESKYSLAKQYGITIEELEKLNPDIVNMLPVGYKLKICKPNPFSKNELAIVNNDSKGLSKSIDMPKNNFLNHHLAEQLVRTASEKIGTRYYFGGTSKFGFDCSGLIYTTFEAFDIKLPRSSFEQSSYGVKIDSEEAKKGDLIFFKTNGSGQINHVGMVVEVCDDEIKFIHASVQNGVIISSTKENYYKNNFIKINRVL